MAIGTDALIEFFGTQDSLDDGSTSAVVDGAYSVAADHTDWTNDDDAPEAYVVLTATWTVAPTVLSTVGLYMTQANIDGTGDEPLPDSTYEHRFMGAFVADAVTTAQSLGLRISLPNSKTSSVYTARIKNNTGQTIPATWTLKITPITVGPHA